MKMNDKKPNDKHITAFIHCALCLQEKDHAVSPAEFARFEIGWTKFGFQVWCRRHDCNVLHVNFEGQKHPADTTRRA